MVVWSSSLTTLRVATQDVHLVRALDARDIAAVFAALEAEEEAIPVDRKDLRAKINEHFPNTTRANDVYAMDILESVVTQGLALRAGAAAKELKTLSTSGTVSMRSVRSSSSFSVGVA